MRGRGLLFLFSLPLSSITTCLLMTTKTGPSLDLSFSPSTYTDCPYSLFPLPFPPPAAVSPGREARQTKKQFCTYFVQATEYVEATQFRRPLTPPFALYYTVLHCAKSFDTSKTTSVPPPPFPHPIHFLLYSPPSLPRSHATPFPRRKKRHREEEAEGPYVFLTGKGGRRGERTNGCSVSSLTF